jgi:hypothetical protein
VPNIIGSWGDVETEHSKQYTGSRTYTVHSTYRVLPSAPIYIIILVTPYVTSGQSRIVRSYSQ